MSFTRRSFMQGVSALAAIFITPLKVTRAQDSALAGGGSSLEGSGGFGTSSNLGREFETIKSTLSGLNEALKPTDDFKSSFSDDFVFQATSFEKETPPPPSPVSGAQSLFDRNSEAIARWAASQDAGEKLIARFAELAKSCALVETKAYVQDKKPGDWARDVARGAYKAGDWKCNVFFAEMAIKAGMEPMYMSGKVFANTAAMLSGQSFRCWQPTNEPKSGDAGVYPNHVFIVEDTKTGMGVSALRTHVTEMVHFTKDAKGHFHPNRALDRHGFGSGPLPEVIFFHYSCPDMQTKSTKTSI